MKAVRYFGREDIRVESVAAPGAPKDHEVLVRPLACGVCGTDLHEFAAGPIVTPVEPHRFTGAKLPQIFWGTNFLPKCLRPGAMSTA